MKCWRFDGFGKLKFEVNNQQADTKQSPTNPEPYFRGSGEGRLYSAADDPRPQMIPPENEEWHGVCSYGNK